MHQTAARQYNLCCRIPHYDRQTMAGGHRRQMCNITMVTWSTASRNRHRVIHVHDLLYCSETNTKSSSSSHSPQWHPMATTRQLDDTAAAATSRCITGNAHSLNGAGPMSDAWTNIAPHLPSESNSSSSRSRLASRQSMGKLHDSSEL